MSPTSKFWLINSNKDTNTTAAPTIQTTRINHLPSTGEITQGYFQLAVTLPTAYSDNNYTVLVSLELASDLTEGLLMPEPLIYTTTSTGFSLQQALPAAADTDDSFNYHILVIHD